MLKKLLTIFPVLFVGIVLFLVASARVSAQYCPAPNSSCPSGQCCFTRRNIDPFICTTQSPFNCRVVFNTSYWPPGSHQESCTSVNCQTNRGTCSQSDDRCLPDPVYGTCSWWNSGCTSSWCSACLKEGCCGPGGVATPTLSPTSPPTPTPAPSCTVNLTPDPGSVGAGSSITMTANVIAQNGSVSRVDFSSTPNVSVNPASDSDPLGGWTSVITGITPGPATITANVYMAGVLLCSDSTSNFEVTNPGAWWQVGDSDVTIVAGDLVSPIPGSIFFDLDGSGGFPGVPMFSGNYDFSSGVGSGSVSSTSWLSDAAYVSLSQYHYAYFLRLVPGDAIRSTIASNSITPNYLKNQGAESPDGYKWYFRDGDLTMQGEPTLGSDKVILFVNGNLTIDGIIDLTRGSGFFMAIVSGNITVDPDVRHPSAGEPELEGLFVANGNFISGSDGDDEQLHIRGMVTAYQQVQLDKNLSDNTTTPSELFTYAPDLLFNYPRSLTLKRTRWKEVTP